MLSVLGIRDFAIISALEIEFGPGFTVLTGETGAGKSIIIDALGLALGERAFSEMIKTGSDSASVEALFVEDGGGQIILKRSISGLSGKNRAYINGSLATVQELMDAGRGLVDIHGQHEHQSLLVAQNQLTLLDRSAGLEAEKAGVAALYSQVAALKDKIKTLRDELKERTARRELLSFQLGEIQTADLSEGEDEKLLAERKVLSSLTRLRVMMEEARALLEGGSGDPTGHPVETGALPHLGKLKTLLAEAASIDPRNAEPGELLQSAMPLIEEVSMLIKAAADRYEPDPRRLDSVEERLELIGRLKKKYGGSIVEILKYARETEAAIEGLSTLEESWKELEAALQTDGPELERLSRELSAKRKKAASAFEKSVTKVLAELALGHAVFKIDFKETPAGPDGIDSVSFLFSANPGEPPKPVARTASGGELSRLMLAIKSAGMGQSLGMGRPRGGGAGVDVPVVIFDEVDAGIGGRTADNVGRHLLALSRTRQVLCVTHLPQIASLADRHFLVEKITENQSVSVRIRALEGQAREEEIARMLGGKVTGASVKHARELIRGAGSADSKKEAQGELL